MRDSIKYLLNKIDWDVVAITVLVGLIPSWLIIGAMFFPFFTSYYGR